MTTLSAPKSSRRADGRRALTGIAFVPGTGIPPERLPYERGDSVQDAVADGLSSETCTL